MVEVKLYSTPTCPYCVLAKKYLQEKGIDFQEINVAADRQAAQEMIKRSGHMGVPQLLIGDKLIIGFDKPAIDKELEALKKKK